MSQPPLKPNSSPWPAPAAIGFLAVAVMAAASYCDELHAPARGFPSTAAVVVDAAPPEDAGEDKRDGAAEIVDAGVEEPSAAIDAGPRKRRKLPRLRSPRVPRQGWPISFSTCPASEECETAEGEPGYRCSSGQKCFNPCPIGMVPGYAIGDETMCFRLCNDDHDCPGSAWCVDAFLPASGGERPPSVGLCYDQEEPKNRSERSITDGGCTTSDDRQGYQVEGDPRCYPWCKRGLVLYGGTNCAKPCRTNGDCPGGWCERDQPSNPGVCAPVCPSEGCPYPWE